jgi:hypothetical protein
MSYITSIQSYDLPVSGSSQEAPVSWASILDMLRRLQQELHVASVKQASDASQMAAKSGQAVAASQLQSGIEDRNLAFTEAASAGATIVGSVASTGMVIKAFKSSNEAFDSKMGAAKITHALERTGGTGSAGTDLIETTTTHDDIKKMALAQPELSLAAGANRANANRAVATLRAEGKEAADKASHWNQMGRSGQELINAVGKCVESGVAAKMKEKKAIAESLGTLHQSLKELQSTMRSTADKQSQNVEALAATVANAQAEILRALNSRG